VCGYGGVRECGCAGMRVCTHRVTPRSMSTSMGSEARGMPSASAYKLPVKARVTATSSRCLRKEGARMATLPITCLARSVLVASGSTMWVAMLSSRVRAEDQEDKPSRTTSWMPMSRPIHRHRCSRSS
jgi:hypothetical protein